MSARREVIVVGGGQAGLAIGRLPADEGRDFTILEAAAAPAATWRERWDSLVLFTPVRYDSLPGKPSPGDPDHYPTRDEVIAHLEEYARDLPVELNSRVTAVRPSGRRLRRRARGAVIRGGAGRHRDRPVPGSVHPAHREPAGLRCPLLQAFRSVTGTTTRYDGTTTRFVYGAIS
jgi:glycine/D-amino acid oxidase-like deaminating enzyme